MGTQKKGLGKIMDDFQTKRARDKAVRGHMNRSDIPYERRVKVVKRTAPKRGNNA